VVRRSWLVGSALVVALVACGESGSAPAKGTASLAPRGGAAGSATIVHLADALDAAQVSVGSPPAGGRPPRVWSPRRR